jgi:Cu/Ag efflux protein CusF
MMRTTMLPGLLTIGVLVGCSKQDPAPPAPKATTPVAAARPDTVGAAVGAYVKERVKVVSVDTVTRVVVLESEDGDTETITVSREVKRLNAVRAGDVMIVEYVEAVALDVRKTGAGPAKMTERDTLIRLPGEKPTGIAGKVVTATVQVVGIDPKEQEVTVKTGDSKASTRQIKVDDPDVLAGLKLGDRVDVTYVEALGISFDK